MSDSTNQSQDKKRSINQSQDMPAFFNGRAHAKKMPRYRSRHDMKESVNQIPYMPRFVYGNRDNHQSLDMPAFFYRLYKGKIPAGL